MKIKIYWGNIRIKSSLAFQRMSRHHDYSPAGFSSVGAVMKAHDDSDSDFPHLEIETETLHQLGNKIVCIQSDLRRELDLETFVSVLNERTGEWESLYFVAARMEKVAMSRRRAMEEAIGMLKKTAKIVRLPVFRDIRLRLERSVEGLQ